MNFIQRHMKLSRNLQDIAKATAKAIAKVMGKDETKHITFSLFVWHNDPEHPEGGYSSYVGTCDREDMIPVLEQMIERWKAGDGWMERPLHERN